MTEKRLLSEIEHGKKIALAAGEIWNWESPAGKRRWRRRARMLINHISQGQKILEMGCGTRYFTKELVKTGADDDRAGLEKLDSDISDKVALN